MTREQLLRYAQLTGGMFGQAMTQSTDQLFTLDKVQWSGNTYAFTYNVQSPEFSFKQIIKLPDMLYVCIMFIEHNYSLVNSKQQTTAFNMLYKLHKLTQKDPS